jgi:ribose 5-phosphate isomerase B
MKIAIGADHAGYELKGRLARALESAGHEVLDCGTHDERSTDYPEWGAKVARSVVSGAAERGVLVCGTGIGVAMAANRIRGCRAANCNDLYSVELARRHNDANVLTVGARVVAPALAESILEVFLSTPFEGGRHQRRVEGIDALLDEPS